MNWPDDYINKIICGDCLEAMKGMPDKCVDLVITDPPYNAGREYDNDSMSEKEYLEFTEAYLLECLRILKHKGNLVIIMGIKYQAPVLSVLMKHFVYNWQYVLYKSNGMLNGKATFAKWDSVLWFSKGEADKWNRQKDGIFSGDVWNCPINPVKNDRGHPTPKDKLVLAGIVTLFSNEDDIAFDPFLGSGTTAVACKELNRKYIGVEISPEYCEIARKRLDNTQESFEF